MNLIAIHLTFFAILFLFFTTSNAQRRDATLNSPPASTTASIAVTSSPAYAELLLRKTELTSELESLVLVYTEEYPKVKEIRFTLSVLQRESERLNKLKPNDWLKLTLALGRLIVRKSELETDAWKLLQNYKEQHPDVKRARRKVDIYETAIKEILG